ncbi:CBS domain-containing protein [Halodesulfurarchaeum sp. HSR-GB]|uniref:CBS domain-containing protein n=1 Tax=Halodesulfurarchaeum sp. HSR-GB TaxID=3074077 RepID=UPI00285CA6A2|nr:CBS domain-containing protein [Halodesulfurarchaeum sp. HSR-GB]MDR5657224.1 CBS domain-containing protein [Halodesulfurarchaeum sp. HSR-GB]
MEDVFVARLMTSELITANPDTFVEDAAQTLLENHIGSIVVSSEEGEIEGILTNTDFIRIVAESKPKAKTTVERYMSDAVVTIGPQAHIQEAADVMIEENISHLPVVDEDDLVIGIITKTDLTAYLSAVQEPTPA